jgi:hypothetical protein
VPSSARLASASRISLLLSLTLAAGAGQAAAPTQVFTLQPAADTSIFGGLDDISDGQGGSLWTSVTASGLVRRALLRFDLSAIPDDQRVVSASLSLYLSNSRGAHDIGLHRMTASWGEGASNGGNAGVGDIARPGDATWRWRDYQLAEWSTPGGDFALAASSTAFVGLQGLRYTWDSTAAMVGDVQGWLDDPASNHGWIMIGDEVTQQGAKRFASRHDVDASLRPLLVVHTAPIPEPATWALWAAGLAGLVGVARRRRG